MWPTSHQAWVGAAMRGWLSGSDAASPAPSAAASTVSAAPARVISAAELKEHAFKRADASSGPSWLVIAGDVYDVAAYARVHPGGAPVLLNASVRGVDATRLFIANHPWVNARAILAPVLVARACTQCVCEEPPASGPLLCVACASAAAAVGVEDEEDAAAEHHDALAAAIAHTARTLQAAPASPLHIRITHVHSCEGGDGVALCRLKYGTVDGHALPHVTALGVSISVYIPSLDLHLACIPLPDASCSLLSVTTPPIAAMFTNSDALDAVCTHVTGHTHAEGYKAPVIALLRAGSAAPAADAPRADTATAASQLAALSVAACSRDVAARGTTLTCCVEAGSGASTRCIRARQVLLFVDTADAAAVLHGIAWIQWALGCKDVMSSDASSCACAGGEAGASADHVTVVAARSAGAATHGPIAALVHLCGNKGMRMLPAVVDSCLVVTGRVPAASEHMLCVVSGGDTFSQLCDTYLRDAYYLASMYVFVST